MCQCTKCNEQYIGETLRHIHDRFSEHGRAIEKAIQKLPISNPTAVSDHFMEPNHTLLDLQLIPLELVNSNRDSVRKAREAYLISRAKCLKPLGMNRRDDT